MDILPIESVDWKRILLYFVLHIMPTEFGKGFYLKFSESLIKCYIFVKCIGNQWFIYFSNDWFNCVYCCDNSVCTFYSIITVSDD